MDKPLPQVGSQVVNTRRLPVYALPNGRRVIEIEKTETGDIALLSVEGAKTLKNGQYPLHPELDRAVAAEFYGEQPFALRSDAEQEAGTRSLLSAVLSRLFDAGTFEPSPN